VTHARQQPRRGKGKGGLPRWKGSQCRRVWGGRTSAIYGGSMSPVTCVGGRSVCLSLAGAARRVVAGVVG
jgi:hypothetical protein